MQLGRAAVLTTGRPLPVDPDNRTFSDFDGVAQRYQQETHATAAKQRSAVQARLQDQARTVFWAPAIGHSLKA
jgi:hypothetical protein